VPAQEFPEISANLCVAALIKSAKLILHISGNYCNELKECSGEERVQAQCVLVHDVVMIDLDRWERKKTSTNFS